jgi:hypothetical protein
MTEHGPLLLAQRNHVQTAVGAGSPVHAALAVNAVPAWGVPLISGPAVICGAAAARA